MPNTLPDLPTICALAFDAMPHGVLIVDADAPEEPIVYANPAFERMTGYGTEEIVGWNCRFLQGSETDRDEVARIREAIDGRRLYQGLLRNYRKDGTSFWNELTIGPISGGAAPARYLFGVQLDVTRRLELEERLRDSQKMEALGKLTGGIAHDFNNLLALILGNAEVIADHCPPESLPGAAARDVVDATLAGSSLIRRMLDFSRGQRRPSERIGVNRRVEDAIALLSRTLSDRVTVTPDLAAEAGEVMVDATLFETALINLAVNARDAMPDGGVITITTGRRSDALPGHRDAVAVTVSDTGIGMDEETARRAFEPYYSTKGPERGTGLGLAMVYGFAEQSGGRATIHSAPGQGTRVELLLPPAPEDETGTIARADAEAKAARILLVEDEAKFRTLVASQLASEGYAVDEAGSVDEAAKLLAAKGGYAAIVSDIRLPGGASGLALASYLSERAIAAGLVLMTGFSEEIGEIAGQERLTVLRKPFRKAELLTAVRAAIRSN